MKTRKILICGGVLALALAAGSARAQTMALAPGDPVPPLVAWDLDGRLQTIEWTGITLVNFWATWCKPCREEMPVLQQLHTDNADLGFRVIGMTKDHDITIDAVKKFLDEINVDYPIFKSDVDARWEFVLVVPTSFLIDAQGKVIRKYVGATPAQVEGLKQDVDNLLRGLPMEPLVMTDPGELSD